MWQLYKFQKVMKVTGEQHLLCFNIKIQQFSAIKHLPISLLTFISHTASIHLLSLICPKKKSTWRWVIICLVTILTYIYIYPTVHANTGSNKAHWPHWLYTLILVCIQHLKMFSVMMRLNPLLKCYTTLIIHLKVWQYSFNPMYDKPVLENSKFRVCKSMHHHTFK
jgi:hypothetical protein